MWRNVDTELDSADLSIGELARRTGIPPATLRIWEERYGVPAPRRRRSGHRRYSEEDARFVLHVKRARDEGAGMPDAIDAARQAIDEAETSVFAGLRMRHPDLPVLDMPEVFLLGISHAIEDEAAEHARGAVIVGAFQRRSAWERSARHWKALGSVARAVIVLADFPRPHCEDTRFEIPIDPAGPVAQEWIVIVDAPSWAACLVARELDAPHRRRRFESVWSMDRGVVRDAARLAVTIAARTEPGVTGASAPVLRTRPAPIDDGLQRATALTNRILGNLLRSAQRADVRAAGSREGRNVSP